MSLGPWALDSLGFVAYEEAGRLGWGAAPPHLQKHAREEATSQKSKKPKGGDAGVLLVMLRMRKAKKPKAKKQRSQETKKPRAKS